MSLPPYKKFEPSTNWDVHLVGDGTRVRQKWRLLRATMNERARRFRRHRWAMPYAAYDIGAKDGFVSVGVDHDTPVFAVTSIEAWWNQVGAQREQFMEMKESSGARPCYTCWCPAENG